jgi:hypothetical protein
VAYLVQVLNVPPESPQNGVDQGQLRVLLADVLASVMLDPLRHFAEHLPQR